jgi:hypothetical protein
MRKKTFLRICALVFIPLLLIAGGINDLLGKWEFTSEEGSVTLEFKSATLLVYNGEQIGFELAEGIIRVEDEIFGWVDYPYALEGGVLTINYPEGYSLQFKKAKPEGKGSKEKGSAAVSGLAAHFVGTWKNYTQNTETMVVLYPKGTYGYRYTSSYGSAESGEEWGAAGEQHAQGTWKVQGTREQGVIVFTGNDGSQTEYNYQVHVENGEVYWNEYYFNGNLYGKNMD